MTIHALTDSADTQPASAIMFSDALAGSAEQSGCAMSRFQRVGTGVLALALSILPLSSTALSTPTASASPVTDDGPHSPTGRVPAPTTVIHDAQSTTSRYDFGDVEIGKTKGQFRAPVRGSLVTPAHAMGPTKLIIISHLRTGGCADHTFAFPCPGKDIRLDRGMEYLGKALAAKGYTVLIPDVAPVWIGTTLQDPYDQVAAWLKVVGAARQKLADDVAGGSENFHLPLQGAVDTSGAGLFVHSRSGFIAGPAVQAWRKGPMPITSVLAYGPAYDVPDANDHITPPIAGDVPYLGLVGDADDDVPYNANLWLAENVEQRRTAPALVATVPGLGHNYINQALSSTRTDDRLDCTPSTCPTAATHEQFLTSVSEQFFDATLRRSANALPLSATSNFPATLGGLPAQWLAVTNSTSRISVLNADGSGRPSVSKGSSVVRCRFYDPQDPTPHNNACPDTEAGSVMMVSTVYRVNLKARGSLTVATHLNEAQALELQITPYGDRPDYAASSPLTVTVHLADGRTVTVPVPADAQRALANRSTVDAGGSYPLGTMRIPLPSNVNGSTITSVTLTAANGGTYAIRAIDALAASGGSVSNESPASPAQGSGASSTPTPSTRPAKPVVGPLVQTG